MKLLLPLAFILLMIFLTSKASAQMMGGSFGSISNEEIIQQQMEELDGKEILDNIQANKTTCQNLTDDNFEKIGEYFMGQMIGNTARHISMNNMMISMMGEQGEAQMHIAWGKRGSGCNVSAQSTPNMMGSGGMMNGFRMMR